MPKKKIFRLTRNNWLLWELTRSPYTPSIDKINPLKGYTKENSQVVCWWYNVSKQQFTDKQVIDLCRKVVETADQI